MCRKSESVHSDPQMFQLERLRASLITIGRAGPGTKHWDSQLASRCLPQVEGDGFLSLNLF